MEGTKFFVYNYDEADVAVSTWTCYTREAAIQKTVERLHDDEDIVAAQIDVRDGYLEGWFPAYHLRMTDTDHIELTDQSTGQVYFR